MSNWLSIHKKRHTSSGGETRKVYQNDTITYINTTFDQSPSYSLIKVDSLEMDARIVDERDYQTANEFEMKKMLLRPLTVIERGSYVEYEDDIWLTVFYHKDDLYPKAYIRFCNNELVFPSGNIYPCVVDNKVQRFQTVEENTTMMLPSDTLAISVKATPETRKIKKLDRFVIDEAAWEVQVVDMTSCVYKGVGVVELALKQIPLSQEELPEEIIPPIIIPDKDYHVEIEGIEEVEIDTAALYIATVYLDGQPTNETVIWSIEGDGSIDTNGIYSASSTPSNVTIVAQFDYIDNNNNPVTKEARKEITVFDNNDWGGWN